MEMGYASGNAFFGYNPDNSLFELYSDIGESLPSDAIFDGNAVTKGILQCDIHGNVTGNLVGNVITDNIHLNSGAEIQFFNGNETGWASIYFNETENKLQLQNHLIRI